MTSERTLTINGRTHAIAAPPETPLLDVLRNDLGLVGTRFGCGEESCGACMVLIDGTPRYACTTTVGTLAGKVITTVEGLGTPAAPHPVQQALIDVQAGQCGYCLSGIAISAAALIARTPSPSRPEIIAALEPHLCRCGTHHRIIQAVERAATLAAETAS